MTTLIILEQIIIIIFVLLNTIKNNLILLKSEIITQNKIPFLYKGIDINLKKSG